MPSKDNFVDKQIQMLINNVEHIKRSKNRLNASFDVYLNMYVSHFANYVHMGETKSVEKLLFIPEFNKRFFEEFPSKQSFKNYIYLNSFMKEIL